MTMHYIFNTENLSPDEYAQLTIRNPEWFLFHCRAGGYQFEIINDSLKVTPMHAIDEDMHNLLKQHKHSLIKLIESEVGK